MDRDQEWIIAMATALGTDSGMAVPIIPEASPFRHLFEAIAAKEREACAHEADHWQAIENRSGHPRPHQAGAYIAAAIRGRSNHSLSGSDDDHR